MVDLFGSRDELLKLIEQGFDAAILVRGNEITLSGEPREVGLVSYLFEELMELVARGHPLTADSVVRSIEMVRTGNFRPSEVFSDALLVSRTKSVRPKTAGQKQYVDAMRTHTIVFAIGPAGTGKTYLAVASAIQALAKKEVRRIILTRPAVEAGEKLGFLPGDIAAKVDPYLKPLYDALYEMLEPEAYARAMERGEIEVAPLAFMRGRTLNDSFIILDEAQNTSPEQMKMFLTRLGFGSRAVVTGDITQIDRPEGVSGLVSVQEILHGIDGVAFSYLDARDVVRHKIVQQIVEAYRRFAEAGQGSPSPEGGRLAQGPPRTAGNGTVGERHRHRPSAPAPDRSP
ncbi:MAG TPA: PhoH family protein [Actinomycetota bacterium]|nr:PhoH family protein [Actinomycetota bacterium]